MNLRKYAKGKPCMIRSEVCNGDWLTTVLCHMNGGGWALKHHDFHGAWGCFACHHYVDEVNVEEGKRLLQDAIIRTQIEILRTHKLILEEDRLTWADRNL